MAITESLSHLLADLRALRNEINASPARGADPLMPFANDLAAEIMRIGGLNTSYAPQVSGKQPDASALACDMDRWRESLARPREPQPYTMPAGHDQSGRRF